MLRLIPLFLILSRTSAAALFVERDPQAVVVGSGSIPITGASCSDPSLTPDGYNPSGAGDLLLDILGSIGSRTCLFKSPANLIIFDLCA